MAFISSLFQVAMHAIGDKANDLILDIYESVVSTNGMRDRRFRVNLRKWLTIFKIFFLTYFEIKETLILLVMIFIFCTTGLMLSDWACTAFRTWGSCPIWSTRDCCFCTGFYFNHLLGIILFESCYSYSACNCSFLGFFCIKAHSWKCYVNLLLSAIIRMNDSSFHLPLWSSLIFNSNGQHAKCMLSVYESLETCTLCRFWMLGNDPYLFIKIEGNVNWRQIQV